MTLPAEFTDVQFIARDEIPESATTVLLGECTHGTEEFYRLRAEISKYLIKARGFQIILCESDWTFMWHVNQYIHRKKSNMFPDAVRFPDWMWKNRPFHELIEWMRKRASSDGPHVFGMDCYCREESKEEVLKFFDFHDRETLGKEFRRTCFPVDQPDQWPNILAKLQWEIENDSKSTKQGPSTKTTSDGSRGGIILRSNKFHGCSKLDQFNAEQNLECMIAADEYYSKQRLEPPGSRASWNARDQHMMTTILRLRAHARELFGVEEQELKIIVWAHNSHVGDATSTPMGGVNFERNEKWNLGQMCRNTLENVFIVGFYSYEGEVRAAKSWGDPGQVMTLRPALSDSFEHRMHQWFPNKQGCFPLHTFRGQLAANGREFDYKPGAMPLNVPYRAVHSSVLVTKDSSIDKQRGEAADGSDDESKAQKQKQLVLDPAKPFTPIKRVRAGRNGEVLRLQISDYDGGQYDGFWVTEYVHGGSRTIMCLPAAHLDALSGSEPTADAAAMVANFPILQRWVGVKYHPESELQSHYGEMVIGKCYDLALFVDRTNALDVDLQAAAAQSVSVTEALGVGQAENIAATHLATPPPSTTPTASAQHNRRLMMEYRRILKTPIEYIETRPLESNILEWHFVISGAQDPYLGGKYHGILEFPDDFPMKPPSIKLLTPSGRFEINKRICLSMSDFHKESWNPSWTVEKILIGLMSFMYEESSESIGSLLESKADRRRYAAESQYFNAQNEIYVELFQTPDDEEVKDDIRKLRKVMASDSGDGENEKACRYCFVESGDLVAPCECKGSGAWVHLGCLRQWQKSVLVTQSTHPRFQTRIDEICNVCEKPFKDEYKPPSRREQMLEYTGEELPKLIQKGNLLASSRHKSEMYVDRIRQSRDYVEKIGHFTQAVYFIALFDKYDPDKRGGGPVLGVNLVRQIEQPLERTSRPLLGANFGAEVTARPLREWQQKYVDWVKCLQNARALSVGCVEHFLGGPVEPAEAFAMIEIPAEMIETIKSAASSQVPVSNQDFAINPNVRRELSKRFDTLNAHRILLLASRLRVKGNIYFGEILVVLELLANVFLQVGHCHGEEDSLLGATRPLKVFWGYASWNVTQLLGEIARRSWGLVITDASLSFETWDRKVGCWEAVVDQSVVAKESEYSRY